MGNLDVQLIWFSFSTFNIVLLQTGATSLNISMSESSWWLLRSWSSSSSALLKALAQSHSHAPIARISIAICKPAFLLGAITSLVSGFLRMKIATYANARTTLEARKGVGKAFITAFRYGAVMGILLAACWSSTLQSTYLSCIKAMTGRALWIYYWLWSWRLFHDWWFFLVEWVVVVSTKKAADLVGKVERNIPERNPAVSYIYYLFVKFYLFYVHLSLSNHYIVRAVDIPLIGDSRQCRR